MMNPSEVAEYFPERAEVPIIAMRSESMVKALVEGGPVHALGVYGLNGPTMKHPVAIVVAIRMEDFTRVARSVAGKDAIELAVRNEIGNKILQLASAGEAGASQGGDRENGDDWKADDVTQFFAFEHLTGPMRAVSEMFANLARDIVRTTRRCPERTVALRKLLESKDCAVRAVIWKDKAER